MLAGTGYSEEKVLKEQKKEEEEEKEEENEEVNEEVKAACSDLVKNVLLASDVHAICS